MGFARSFVNVFQQDILVTLLSFVSSVFLARWLGPEQLGLFYIVSLIPNYSEKFGRVGNFDHAGVYFIKIRRYKLENVAAHVTIVSFLTALLPIALFLIFSPLFYTHVVKGAHIPFPYILTALAGVPFAMLLVSYQKLFIGEHQVGVYNLLRILNPALTFIGVLIFYVLGWDYYGVILAGLLASIATSAIAYRQMDKLAPMKYKFNGALVKDLFGYGWKIYFLSVLSSIHLRADLFLVVLYLDASAVTFYGMAVTIGQMLWKIPNALSVLLFPRVASQKPEESADFTVRICRYSIYLLFLIAVLMLIVSPWVIKVIYGDRFMPLFKPLMFLMPGILAMSTGRLLTEHFYGQGHPRGILWGSMVATPLNIGLNVFLIPRYGIAAAAAVSSLTYGLFTCWMVVEFSRRWKRSFIDFFILTTDDMRDIFKRFSAYLSARKSYNSPTK